MKVSIFPEALAHPQGKDEKRRESFKVSTPYLPQTVVFNNDEELLQFVTTYAWSPFVFSGVRDGANFVSTDLLVYDIDEGLTIDDAKAIVLQKGICCLCLPSPSHTEEAHRFRIIMPLARTIFSPDIYRATWKSGAEIFGTIDEQCKDIARYYFGSTTEDGFWEEGTLFEPVVPATTAQPKIGRTFSTTKMLPVDGDISAIVNRIYGESRAVVPEAVDYFVRNAHTGMRGEWTNALSRFCFSLALSGVDNCTILAVCSELAPDELDRKDLYQIERAIRDGKAEI